MAAVFSYFRCLLLIFVILIGFFPTGGLGADGVSSWPLSFGTIDLHPAGDTITINASGGAATPSASSGSVVTGGSSGLITVTSESVEHVDIIYPASVTMTSGASSITITGIDTNSEYSVGGVDTLGGGIPLTISVGGKINISSGQANGSYSAVLRITLNYS
jgi:hypothetical protein